MNKKILSLTALALFVGGGLQAQNTSQALQNLRMGKLPSGLTYYIYPTEANPGELNLYLVQNIGGVVEQDKEQGMAHFMEHLSFNKSQHFPSGIMNYLLANPTLSFDAKTGINETKYQINNIPTADKGKVDTALLILRDWVEGIQISPDAVEKERGIVLEEWRQRAGVDRRLTDSIAPALYPNSPYAYRNTIGQEGTLRAFTVKELRDFQKRWYRPELQAIMIVGDIKAEDYEARLRQLFKAKPSKKPISRSDIQIANNSVPTYYRFVDRENNAASLGFYQRIAASPTDKSRNYVAEHLYHRIFDNVIARRLARLRNEGREDFIAQTVSTSSLVRSYDQIAWDIVPYSGRGEAALKQALSLREQLRREGISAEEFDAEQSKMLEEIKGLLEEKNLDMPDNLMGIFKTHFLYGTPLKSLREELEASYETLVEMEADDVNGWLAKTLTDDNLAFITYSNRAEEMNIPLNTFQRLLREVKAEPTFRFAEVKSFDRIIDFDIKPGKIVKEALVPQLETKEWTLSNGAKMLYKYVPEMKGQFYFVASSLGGRSAVKPQDLPAFTAMRSLIMRAGLGKYNRNDIHHWLQGKDIELSLSIENYNEGIGGNAPVAEAQNFFEYLYMVLTKQNFNETDLAKYKDLQKYLYTTRMATPRGQVDEQVKATLYPYTELNPREDIGFYDRIRLSDMQRVYAERMLSASDFTFCILGDLPEVDARKLSEQYIASLPKGTLPAREDYKPLDFAASDKHLSKTITADFEGNVGEVELAYILDNKLSEREELALPVLESLLQARMFEELREREQGVYSVGLQLRYEAQPKAQARLNIHFNTERDKVDKMKQKAYEVLREVAEAKFSDLAFKHALMPHALSSDEVATTPEENPLMWLLYLNAYVETGKVPELNKSVQAPKVESLTKQELATLIAKFLSEAKHRDIVVKSTPRNPNFLH